MRLVWSLLLTFLSCSAGSPLEFRLEQQMKSWQKRLGLEEWNLSLRLVRQWEIDRNAWGTAEWNPDAKTAVINVLDPRDYNLKGGDLKLDMECTIVHELVHIQVSPLAARNQREREEVVDKIMVALLNRQCPN